MPEGEDLVGGPPHASAPVEDAIEEEEEELGGQGEGQQRPPAERGDSNNCSDVESVVVLEDVEERSSQRQEGSQLQQDPSESASLDEL